MFLLLGIGATAEIGAQRLEETEVVNQVLFTKIDKFYNYILAHPSLTSDEKEMIINSQIGWQDNYEREAIRFKIRNCTDDNEGIPLEIEIWDFKNREAEARMKILKNICDELDTRL
jgi:hypothetical protein